MLRSTALAALALVLATVTATAQEEKIDAEGGVPASTFSVLKAREVGPALLSGRIGDLAHNPNNRSEYYVASCSGGVWKTTNNGMTFEPVFDSKGSYSIGCISVDQDNPSVVWVGTGENNSQRSVSFGDGVYKSIDGGASWKNVGLRTSEHIGMIAIDPSDSNTVYVAAQGPLWRAGGERGLYKTTDGGATWNAVLSISDDTGCNEVFIDPRDPQVIYASTYQRRRRTWTLINGGPESGIHKSTDGGATWRKLTRGLPGGDKGRIGMAMPPSDPDMLYAIIEAQKGGGVFRSTDRGETWKKRSDYMCTSPQYYNELVADPHLPNRLYVLDTVSKVSSDGGKTFQAMGRTRRHVDDHALTIDPRDTDHLLLGSDGGLYESYDRGISWQHKSTLSLTQFYRVAVDNSWPFYYIYGGTQDNNTLGGPSRTTSTDGIANEDWFVTVGGDGFEPQVDPSDPNIVYSQWQYGGLIRYDRRTGERLGIKPQAAPGDATLRWNWDSPLLISPHEPKRLYFAANKLFRSDDRGESWTCISEDLSRGLDRNQLEVMGRVQKVDAVSKNRSTSVFGNCVSLSESPMIEGLIYVGTDDGLIQITENNGKSWRKESTFPDVPDMSYVSCLTASRHEADVVYATFDNHKSGDFKPYILRSADRGRTWTSITGNLGEREIAYTLQEDHVMSGLLFLGTEFGGWFTQDTGKKWIKMGGLPTIAVRDIDIQRRESDVVMATFGRGFYVLDDYAMLRHVDASLLESESAILPTRRALLYATTSKGRGSQGATYWTTKNPAYGATITYWLKETLSTRKERRKKAEKDDGSKYPTFDELRAEDNEKAPRVFVTITDSAGNLVRRLKASRNKGLHRMTWDLRHSGFAGSGSGPRVAPGNYTARLSREVDGELSTLPGEGTIEVVALEPSTFTAPDPEAVIAWHRKVGRLQRALDATSRALTDATTRLEKVRGTLSAVNIADTKWMAEEHTIRGKLNAISVRLSGDQTRSSRNAATPTALNGRVRSFAGALHNSTSGPTGTHVEQYNQSSDELKAVLALLRPIVQKDIPNLEAKVAGAGGPIPPDQLPTWK